MNSSIIPVAGDSQNARAATPSEWQFSTRSLFWLVLTAGLAVAFARGFGPWGVAWVLITPSLAAIVACGLAVARGLGRQVVDWAVIGALVGSILTLWRHSDEALLLGPIVLAIAGGYAATEQPIWTRATILASGAGILPLPTL